MNSILEIDTLAVVRHGKPILQDISFGLEGGYVTALLGANGAGKTSLIETISGILPLGGGRLLLDGEDISYLARHRRARRGLVHVEQGRAIFPSLTVRENIMLTADTTRTLDYAISFFPELEKRLSALSAVLSGGEQQMVVLARALAATPRFLLIDEMSLGLAPVIFLRLLPIVRDIARSGVAVLLVEQFAQHALGVSDIAIVLNNGTAAFQGPAQTLSGDRDRLADLYLGSNH